MPCMPNRPRTWEYTVINKSTDRHPAFALAAVRVRCAMAVSALLLLASCESLMPPDPVQVAPRPVGDAEWSRTAATPAVAAGALLPWRSYFDDPDLQALIALALVHNSDMRLAVINITQAQAQWGIRSADQLPTVNAVAGVTRAPNAFGAQTTSVTTGLAVTAYEFDFFGRISGLKEQALAQYLATQEARRTTQITLVTLVAQAWIALLADARNLELAQQALASRQASLNLLRLRAAHGVSSALELRQSESFLEGVRVTLAQLERQMALDENALTLLLGQAVPQAQVARFQAARFGQFRLPELPAGLPSELLVRRADIRQAEQGLKAANANIAAARAAFFPRISLTATAGVASTELGTLLNSGTLAFSLAPQVLMSLFDAGRNRATWELARAAAEASMVQYEKSVQVAFREVADALATRAGWARQLQAQQAQTQADMERLRLVALRLEHGAASQLDVLELERTVLADQQALTAAQWAYLQSQVTLYKVLGGGPDE